MNKITNVDSVYCGTNKIFISRRDENKKRIIENVNFKPYFYIKHEDSNRIQLDSKYCVVFGEIKKTFLGQDVIQSICDSDYQKREIVVVLEAMQIKHFEADIETSFRYVIDTNIQYDIENQVICYFDIETLNSVDVDNAPASIISISCYDTLFKKYRAFVWKKDIKSCVIENEDVIKYYFDNEKSMILRFVNYLNYLKPELFSGWYIRNFDFPYLINRMKNLALNPNFLSPLYDITYKSCIYCDKSFYKGRNQWTTNIKGSSVIDLYDIYKGLTYWSKPSNYQLDTVSLLELGEEKLAHLGVDKLYEDVEDLMRYNLKDVELCVKLDKRKYLIAYCLSVQNVCPMPLQYTRFFGKTGDAFILHKFKNIVFPSKDYNAKKIEFKGAFAGDIRLVNEKFESFSPKAGIYKNAVFFDAASMYPSLYRTFNVSNDTIDENGDITIPYTIFENNKEIEKTYRVNSEKIGVIPNVLSILSNMRKDAKKERDKYNPNSNEWLTFENNSGGIKTIANSLFGALGLPSFRFYDVRIAAGITALGREMIGFFSETAREMGFKPITHDTDSAVICFDENLTIGQVKDEADKLNTAIGKNIINFVKKFYPSATSHELKFEYEKIFSELMIFDVKKKYVGNLKYKKGQYTDELYFRGIDLVKRDYPQFFKELLEKIIKIMLSTNDINEIKMLISDAKAGLKKQKMFDLAFNKNISKSLDSYKVVPQHVKGLKYSLDILKFNITQNDSPKFIYVKGAKMLDDTGKLNEIEVIALSNETQELPNTITINYDKLIEMFIYRKLELMSCINSNFKFLNNKNYTLGEYI